jgi:hypothetical protein
VLALPWLVAGCGGGSTARDDAAQSGAEDAARDAAASDAVSVDANADTGPRVGPAPVSLGSGDLASAAAYVLLAKTGITGEVTIGATAHFEGVILCATAITLQTGASLHGRALAQTLVALDDNAVTGP